MTEGNDIPRAVGIPNELRRESKRHPVPTGFHDRANIAQPLTLSHNPDIRNAKRLPAKHPKFQLHIPLVATSLRLGRGLHLALFLDYELSVQGVSSGVICACSASRIRSVRGGFRRRQAIVVTREWTLISKARGTAEAAEKLVDLQAILRDKLHHNIPFSTLNRIILTRYVMFWQDSDIGLRYSK